MSRLRLLIFSALILMGCDHSPSGIAPSSTDTASARKDTGSITIVDTTSASHRTPWDSLSRKEQMRFFNLWIDSIASAPADSYWSLFDEDTLCGDPYGPDHSGEQPFHPYTFPVEIFNTLWAADTGTASLTEKQQEQLLTSRDFKFFRSDSAEWTYIKGTGIQFRLNTREASRQTLVYIPCPGAMEWHHPVYVLQNNGKTATVIGKLNVFDKYGISCEPARRKNNPDWFYVSRARGASSGFTAFDHNYYTVEGNKLVCLGNLMESTHYNPIYEQGIRYYFLNAQLLSSDPLRYKYYFNFELNDTASLRPESWYEDSATVTWKYDPGKARIVPDSGWQSFPPAKYFSYLLGASNDLFVQSHAKILKRLIAGDSRKKQLLFECVSTQLKWDWEHPKPR